MSDCAALTVQPLNSIEATGKLIGGVCRATTYNLVGRKKLRLVKVGRRSMITGDSIIALVREGAE